MKTKTAASFIASMMGAGLFAGALVAGSAQASVKPVASAPAVQTATTAANFVAGCGCWRRRCCRCGGGCGWGGGGRGWGGGWGGGGGRGWGGWGGGWW
ncbi:hypothetical protein [Streptosporangium canum]|uniref:hypothetical protein n=2 Tax=Streptosporangium TaxID=2000 RepID=UPI0037B24A40